MTLWLRTHRTVVLPHGSVTVCKRPWGESCFNRLILDVYDLCSGWFA
jgi:hypothetical protein